MNFKRRKPKAVRAGCLLCKPYKIMGNSKHAKTIQTLKALDSFKKLVTPEAEVPVLICNFAVGPAVPIPTFPFCRTFRELEPTANPPPKVDVAVVDVAVKFDAIILFPRISPATESF